MCGIVSFSGKDKFDKEKIKLLMLQNSLERGIDATGLYSPLNNLIKDNVKASQFMVEEFTDLKEDTLFLGHTRHRTVGRDNKSDAHPFKRGNWILEHNGTLKNHIDLCDKYDLSWTKYWVDSDVVCGCIEQSNNLNVLSEIEGAAAFLITNTEQEGILYVFRNKERPLFKGYLEGNMYISSIEDSLKLIGCNHIKEFKENVLYTIKDGDIINRKVIVNKPYTKPIDYYKFNNSIHQPFDNTLYIGSTLRANMTTKFNEVDKNIIKGRFYQVLDLDSTYYFKVRDLVTLKESVQFHQYLVKADKIVVNDLVVPLQDVVELNNSSNVLLYKGFVYVCSKADYQSNILEISDVSTNKKLCVDCPRNFLRIASEDEKVGFMYDNTEEEDVAIEGMPDLDTLDDDNYNEILYEYLEFIDETLQEMIDQADTDKSSPELKLNIIGLLASLKKAKDKFIVYEENASN